MRFTVGPLWQGICDCNARERFTTARCAGTGGRTFSLTIARGIACWIGWPNGLRLSAFDGHVTEGRYNAKLVEGERYLLNLTRYVHLNPVCTKQTLKLPMQERIRLLRGYRWSSYRSYPETRPSGE